MRPRKRTDRICSKQICRIYNRIYQKKLFLNQIIILSFYSSDIFRFEIQKALIFLFFKFAKSQLDSLR